MPQSTLDTLHSPLAPTWCPGCGNFGVWTALRQALTSLALPEEELVIVYGVGCSGNMADFNRVYGFHALHGRGITNAVGIKLANHRLKVVVVAGDGDTYGEGLNHFLSAIRGNHDITILVHDNGVYGLTTGQAAPTTRKGMKTKSTPAGAPEETINPLGMALTCGTTFAARGFSGNIPQLTEIIKQALLHPGCSIVDMYQPCFTFNHEQTYTSYMLKTYDLASVGHQSNDRAAAYMRTLEKDKLPIGIFYQDVASIPFHQHLTQLAQQPLVEQPIAQISLEKALAAYR